VINSSDLNINQIRAVQWNDGPVLVLASPGSGKTAVLTLRVARLFRENKNDGVLALTFTNKAASEMRGRVEQLMDARSNRARLCTFHSFAAEILEQHGSHIGLQPDFRLLTMEGDRISILEEVVRNPDDFPEVPEDSRNLLHLIDRLFTEAYSGNGVFPSIHSTAPWIQTLFTRYCEALIRNNRLDFGSLIYFAVKLLREKPAIARLIHITWTYICVDEFQDTNQAQYEFLRLIAPHRNHNLFAVADDDQVIYQWNGASVQRLLDLRNDYELQIIQFPESYRCPPQIVEHANHLISNHPRMMEKEKLVSHRQVDADVSRSVRCYTTFASLREEMNFVGNDLHSFGLNPADCVVLSRTNYILEHAVSDLLKSGHNAYRLRRKNDFDSCVPGIIMAALRLANFRHDRVELRRLCHQWHLYTGVLINPNSVDAEATLVGGDFLRAWFNIAKKSSGIENQNLLHEIQTKLVDKPAIPTNDLEFSRASILGTFSANLTDFLCFIGAIPATSGHFQILFSVFSDAWTHLSHWVRKPFFPLLTSFCYSGEFKMNPAVYCP